MKVRINRVRGGSMGDQRNYGLVTGSIWNYENKPTTNNVTTTLSPVPRDEATIEAERGETVIGDLDNDGMVEHAKIGGKRHSQGGTPLNVPDGSFVFSDYRGLLIKNKDLLKGIFNMPTNKAVTPAKVAQRYDINKYKMLLNDPESDAMTKKTAQLMIDNNMKKLGQLALVQEGMKGFPDGVPAIALPLLGPDFQQPKGPQTMKKGGTVQYRRGGLTKHQGKTRSQVGFSSDLPDAGIVGYDQFGQPLYTDAEGILTSYFDPQTGQPVFYGGMLPEMGAVANRSNRPRLVYNPETGQAEYGVNPDTVGKAYAEANPIQTMFASMSPIQSQAQHDAVRYMGGNDNQASMLEWIGPAFLGSLGYAATKSGPLIRGAWNMGKRAFKNKKALTNTFKNIFQKNPEAIRGASGAYGEEEAIRRGLFNSKTIDNVKKVVSNPFFQWPAWMLGTYGIGQATGYFDAPTNVKEVETKVKPGGGNDTTPTINVPLINADSVAKMNQDTINKIGMIKSAYPNASETEILDSLRANPNFFDEVFGVFSASDSTAASDSTKVKDSVVVKPPVMVKDKYVLPKKKLKLKGVAGKTGNAVRLPKKDLLKHKSNKMQDEYMDGYKFGGSLNEYDRGGKTFTQYTEKSQIKSNDDYDVIPVGQDIDYGFTVQKFDPDKGYYTITNPDTGETIELDLNDFMSRQGELVDQYNGGRNQWLKDATSSNDRTRKKAVHYFQTEYDKWRAANNLPTYFYGNPDENPYGIDDKFGIYTFSAPGIKKKVRKPEEQPEPQPEPEPQPDPEPNRPDFQGATPYGLGDWFPSDIMAMNTAARMRIPDYKAYYEYMDPALMSPVYRNENFEPISAVTQTVEGLGTGPEARASALGVSGKGLKAASDIIQQTEAQNTDQFLRTQAANVQAINQYGLGNRENRANYINQLNTFEEANAKNLNQKDALYASLFGKGYNHVLNQMLINAQYPYQFQTPYSVTVNPTLKSIYDEPITGGSSGGSYNEAFNYYFKMFSQPEYQLDKKQAIDAANSAARNHLNSVYQSSRRSGTGGATLSPFEL
jgi:hypothetical protein